MFGRRVVSAIVIVLTLTDITVCSFPNNAKAIKGRSLSFGSSPLAVSERNAAFSDDEEKRDDYQNWLEEVELERRADEEIEAAEIAAAAEEEYERIKYNIEREENSVLDKPETRSSMEANGNGHEMSAEKLMSGTNPDEKTERNTRSEKHPIYGKMGVSNSNCDDAVSNLAMDWDPDDPANAKDYTCNSSILKPARKTFKVETVNPEKPYHICMSRNLTKMMEPPVMGHHRPLWARYGKYTYLPWQRWLHNLEHGAVGLLYHKCADPNEVAKAENVLVNCIRRHIITPYELPPDKPMALVSWGSYLYMTHFDEQTVFNFIQNHALKGRENHAWLDGAYDKKLEKPAKLVSDLQESDICPKSRFPEMYDHFSPTKGDKHTETDKLPMESQVPKMEEKQTSLQLQNERSQQVQKRSVGRSRLEAGKSPDNEARSFQRRDADWPKNRVLGTMEEYMLPELEREAAIARLERAEEMTDSERERVIAELEKEEDVARLEREAEVKQLEKDLDTVKKLFRQKVKPFLVG